MEYAVVSTQEEFEAQIDAFAQRGMTFSERDSSELPDGTVRVAFRQETARERAWRAGRDIRPSHGRS